MFVPLSSCESQKHKILHKTERGKYIRKQKPIKTNKQFANDWWLNEFIAHTAPEEVKELKDVTSQKFPNVEKSARDSRSYSFMTLDNGLQVPPTQCHCCVDMFVYLKMLLHMHIFVWMPKWFHACARCCSFLTPKPTRLRPPWTWIPATSTTRFDWFLRRQYLFAFAIVFKKLF